MSSDEADEATDLYVGDGEGVPDAEARGFVSGHLASNLFQQVLHLAGHQRLAHLQLLLSGMLKLNMNVGADVEVEDSC